MIELNIIGFKLVVLGDWMCSGTFALFEWEHQIREARPDLQDQLPRDLRSLELLTDPCRPLPHSQPQQATRNLAIHRFFFSGTFQKLVFMFNYEHKIHNFPIWLHYDWFRLALVRDWELTSTLTASSLGSTAASTTEYSSMTPHSSWFSILHTFKLFSFNFLQDECKQWSPSWHHVPLQNSGSWDTFQVIIKGFVPCKVSVTASIPGHQTWEPQQRPQPVCRGRRLQLPPLREVISREDGGLQVRLRSD